MGRLPTPDRTLYGVHPDHFANCSINVVSYSFFSFSVFLYYSLQEESPFDCIAHLAEVLKLKDSTLISLEVSVSGFFSVPRPNPPRVVIRTLQFDTPLHLTFHSNFQLDEYRWTVNYRFFETAFSIERIYCDRFYCTVVWMSTIHLTISFMNFKTLNVFYLICEGWIISEMSEIASLLFSHRSLLTPYWHHPALAPYDPTSHRRELRSASSSRKWFFSLSLQLDRSGSSSITDLLVIYRHLFVMCSLSLVHVSVI